MNTMRPADDDASTTVEDVPSNKLPPARPQLVPSRAKLTFGLDNYQLTLVLLYKKLSGPEPCSLREPDSLPAIALPFTWRELVNTFRDQVTYPGYAFDNDVVTLGEIHINFTSMEVRRGGHQVRLTVLEFKVLKYFLSNPNRVIKRSTLLDEVWGYHDYPCTRTVDNLVLSLRQKLEPERTRPIYFRTVYGAGYKFTP